MQRHSDLDPPAASSPPPSVRELIGGLVQDTRELVEGHVSAAKLEVRQELAQVATAARQAILSAALIGVAAVLSFLAVAQALAYFLMVPLWLGHAIVAVAAALIGVVLFKTAKRSLDDGNGISRELDRAAHDLRWAGKRAGVELRARD